MYNEADILEIKIDFAAGGDNTVIAAAAGKKIRVLEIFFALTLAQAVTIKSGSTALTGAMTITSLSLPEGNKPRFSCGTNEAFIVNLGVGTQTGGRAYYLLETV